MQIISFSLWGSDRKYIHGALRNVQLALEIYPSWECRFYTDVDKETEQKILSFPNTTLVKKSYAREPWGRFWRFEAFIYSDPNDVVIVRDVDSRLSAREKTAVDEWLASDRQFHIMRDHPDHTFLIGAGMFGARGKFDWSVFHSFNKTDIYGQDQEFLRLFYPQIINSCIVHSSFHRFKGENARPFPTNFDATFFHVGGYVDPTEQLSQWHVARLKRVLEIKAIDDRFNFWPAQDFCGNDLFTSNFLLDLAFFCKNNSALCNAFTTRGQAKHAVSGNKVAWNPNMSYDEGIFILEAETPLEM